MSLVAATIHICLGVWGISKSDSRVNDSLKSGFNNGNYRLVVAHVATSILPATINYMIAKGLTNFSFKLLIGENNSWYVQAFKALFCSYLASSVNERLIPGYNNLYNFINDRTGLLPAKNRSDLPPPYSWVVR